MHTSDTVRSRAALPSAAWASDRSGSPARPSRSRVGGPILRRASVTFHARAVCGRRPQPACRHGSSSRGIASTKASVAARQTVSWLGIGIARTGTIIRRKSCIDQFGKANPSMGIRAAILVLRGSPAMADSPMTAGVRKAQCIQFQFKVHSEGSDGHGRGASNAMADPHPLR